MRAVPISLIISTYERPGPLEQVLLGVQRQSVSPLEIFIADNGSGPATRALLSSWQPRLAAPLRHLWQPDVGFRKTLILNQAVAAAHGDYLVLLDGDCVPHPKFVADHAALAEKDFWVQGRRCFVREKFAPDFSAATTPVGDGCWPDESPAGQGAFASPFRSCAATPASAASSAATWPSGARTFWPSMVLTRNIPAGALGRIPTWARGFIIWAGRANLFMAMPLFTI